MQGYRYQLLVVFLVLLVPMNSIAQFNPAYATRNSYRGSHKRIVDTLNDYEGFDGEYRHGLTKVSKFGKYGFLDSTFKEKIPCRYDRVPYFDEYGHSEVEIGDSMGVIDTLGNEILPVLFENIKWMHYYPFASDLIFADSAGFWGAYNRKGTQIIPHIYSSLKYMEDGGNKYSDYILLEQDGKMEVRKSDGRKIIPLLYYNIYQSPVDEPIFIVSSKDRKCSGVLDSNGKAIIEYGEQFIRIRKDFAIVYKNKKLAALNKYGKILTECKYDYISNIHEARMEVKVDDKYGFIDTNGLEITEAKYDFVSDFDQGYAYVSVKWKWGLIDFDGCEVIPLIYNKKNDSEFVSEVKKLKADWEKSSDRWKLLEDSKKSHNKQLIKPDLLLTSIEGHAKEYIRIGYFSDSLVLVMNEDYLYGYVNIKGEEVIPCIYNEAESFEKGCARVKKNGKTWYINTKGKLLTIDSLIKHRIDGYTFRHLKQIAKSDPYDFSDDNFIPRLFGNYNVFNEGKAVVSISRKEGYLDTLGFYGHFKYEFARRFTDGMAPVANEDYLWGFINDSFKLVVEQVYKNVYSFNEGLAAVKKDDLWGFIDKSGNCVVNYKYIKVSDFINGFSSVGLDTCINGFVTKRFGVIDKVGNTILPFVFYGLSNFNNEGFGCFSNSLGSGIVNLKGEEIIPPVFRDISISGNIITGTTLNGENLILDTSGKILARLK